MRTTVSPILLLLFLGSVSYGQKKQKQPEVETDYVVTIATDFGNINLILFDETPIHKANMIKLIQEGFYDGTTFHRVIDNFMIQGGNPATKEDGGEAKEETLPAEIVPGLGHDQGMVAAARIGDKFNPERRSSYCQFYIVENPKGAHHLDGAYTIFGKVLQGMDTVEKIAAQKVGQASKPVKDIPMTVKVTKLPKETITTLFGYEFPSVGN